MQPYELVITLIIADLPFAHQPHDAKQRDENNDRTDKYETHKHSILRKNFFMCEIMP